MMCFKQHKKMIVWICIVLFLCICAGCIIDVNHRFPNAQIQECNVGQAMEWKGLEYSPIGRAIYTAEEYATAFPSDSQDTDIQKGTMHVVFTLHITNLTQEDVSAKTIMNLHSETKPYVFGNGIHQVGNVVSVIKAGEQDITIQLSSIMASGLVDKEYFNKQSLEKCEYHLVFTYYPVKKVLNFG